MTVPSITKSAIRVVGTFPSEKLGTWVKYDSPLEREFIYFLEYYLVVLKYKTQPFVVSVQLKDGKAHKYTPDFWLEFVDGTKAIVEIEFAAFLNTENTTQQIEIGTRWAKENDHEFMLITDQDIRKGSQLNNLEILYRYRRLGIPQEVISKCLTYISSMRYGAALWCLADHLNPSDPARAKPWIWALMFQHVLEANLDQPIDDDVTLIRLANKKGEVKWPFS